MELIVISEELAKIYSSYNIYEPFCYSNFNTHTKCVVDEFHVMYGHLEAKTREDQRHSGKQNTCLGIKPTKVS